MKQNLDYKDSTCREFMSNWCLSGSCHKCDGYKKERAEELQLEFEKTLPCASCANNDICRYCNSIKRFDFNKEVFNINISCNKFRTQAELVVSDEQYFPDGE